MQTAFQTHTPHQNQSLEQVTGKKRNFARQAAFDPEARTAGSVRSIDFPRSAQQTSLDRLAQAEKPQEHFESALAYAADLDTPAAPEKEQSDSYDFYDVLDVVNPLHHIPLVGTLYRGITGDEIKPAAQIIGGTIYGGPVGAVSSTVNVVIQHETGRDITGNAIAMLAGDTIHEPEIQFDRTRDILNFDMDERTVTVEPASKTNFSGAASAYQKAGRYNS